MIAAHRDFCSTECPQRRLQAGPWCRRSRYVFDIDVESLLAIYLDRLATEPTRAVLYDFVQHSLRWAGVQRCHIHAGMHQPAAISTTIGLHASKDSWPNPGSSHPFRR